MTDTDIDYYNYKLERIKELLGNEVSLHYIEKTDTIGTLIENQMDILHEMAWEISSLQERIKRLEGLDD